jgi:RimJ/RimL family protein N-acetyltransferase
VEEAYQPYFEKIKKMSTPVGNLKTKNLHLKLIDIDDAAFIIELRTNPALNQFLSRIEPDLLEQKKWIEDYKKRSAKGFEYYFVIKDTDDGKVGLVRVYDIEDKVFSWGSWILKAGYLKSYPIESALLVYEFGFNYLKLQKSTFEVLNNNEKVLSFHLKTKAQIVHSDTSKVQFEFGKEDFLNLKSKYKKFRFQRIA